MAEAPAIRLSEARFRWRLDGPWVLDVPALSVPAGEHVFLRGPSGSGKTTLLNLLGGVAAAETGKVEVLGADFGRLPAAARDRLRADSIGFIFQLFNLVPYLGLVENVTLPCKFSPDRAARAVADDGSVEAAAHRLLSHMQLDVADLARRPVTELSVGQQQRVAAARALIGGPALIIADEPTSSIDAEARGAFLDLLFAETARTGATLVFVSHDAGLDARFDRTVALAEINRAAA